ncbi:hypothetical protein STVA_44500 [Allostella vacuolata]|nr:hypothetical protein STVA_44500 [Stella vacuolata]
MALNRFTVSNFEKFGELVKKWARGQVPRPTDKQQFESQLAAEGIIATWPSGEFEIHTIHVEQCVVGTLHLLVPAPEIIAHSENEIGRKSYPLPDYYEIHAFHKPHEITDNDRFHNMRMGDYTVAHCS